MSARVFNPFGAKLHESFSDRRLCKGVQKVKRVLFGPVDREANQKFLDQELAKQCNIQAQRWNFDFKNERNLNPDGMYDWQPMTPNKLLRKRRPSCEIEYDTDDLYCLPEDIIRPRPVKPNLKEPSQMKINRASQQRLITDFMPIKKNPEVTKKLARPAKIPRMSDFAS